MFFLFPQEMLSRSSKMMLLVVVFVTKDKETIGQIRWAKMTTKSLKPILSFRFIVLSPLLACILLVLAQFQKAIRIDSDSLDTFAQDDNEATPRKRPHSFVAIPHLGKNESFGACLMVKDDNDLLYEWLAYHYTILPLRYVLIASDVGSRTNPDLVLQRWKTANTGLQYWSIPASNFTQHTANNNSSTMTAEDHHHALLARQRDFIPYCVKWMKEQGLQWVSLIDTDEFVVLNPIGSNESLPIRPSKDPHAVEPIYHELRSHPSLANGHANNKSVLDIIREVKTIKDLSPCYTMPRVLHGALTNFSCPEARSDVRLAREHGLYGDDDKQQQQQQLHTLRFHQHARKGDFATSKFGKVFLDVSRLPDTVLSRVPKSPHRPYKPECRPGVVHFPEALFYINHYLGSWARYAARQDGRRNREEWEKRAFITTSTSCDKNVTRWFSKFVDLVGKDRARFLLGVGDG
jgi:hypothetical protein